MAPYDEPRDRVLCTAHSVPPYAELAPPAPGAVRVLNMREYTPMRPAPEGELTHYWEEVMEDVPEDTLVGEVSKRFKDMPVFITGDQGKVKHLDMQQSFAAQGVQNGMVCHVPNWYNTPVPGATPVPLPE